MAIRGTTFQNLPELSFQGYKDYLSAQVSKWVECIARFAAILLVQERKREIHIPNMTLSP